MSTQPISPDCLARYGAAAVPRYTSYPTAPHFSAAVGEADYRAWLEQADPKVPLSVYVLSRSADRCAGIAAATRP